MNEENFYKRIAEIIYHTNYHIHFLILALGSFLVLDYFIYITSGILQIAFSILFLIPFLALIGYVGLLILELYFQRKGVMAINMIFAFIFSFYLVEIETKHVFWAVIQDLAYIPFFLSIIYLFAIYASLTPDEPFPTFKKWGRKLVPFKKPKEKKTKK